MSYYGRYKSIDVLIGKTIIEVSGLEAGSDEVFIKCSDGTKYKMYHDQDCCESVSIEDVVGDAEDILGLVSNAYESSNSDDPPPDNGYHDDSYTWTYYTIQGPKYAVTIRWFGSSSGYYSESVSFKEYNESATEVS